jgi:hypothetical protein
MSCVNLKRWKNNMKRKQLRSVAYFLAIALIASLTFGMTACSSTGVTTLKLISISITPSSPANSVVGTTTFFDAVGTYSDGSSSDVTDEVAWLSSNTAIVTMNSFGTATSVAVGTTNITANMSGITSSSIKLTVISLSSIVVTPASPKNLPVGATQQFTATGTYSDGSSADITSQVTWASDTPETATISSAGLAAGIAGGTANITATIIEVTSPSVSLAVEALTSVAVTPATPANLRVGSNQQFTATGTFADGSTEDITSQVTWVSDAPDTAIFNYPGVVAGLSSGTATITASLNGITSPSIPLTVISLSSIVVTPASPTNLAVGSTQQFTATGTLTDGSTEDITSEVIWSSDTPTTATITSSGLATGIAAGITNITATVPEVVTSPAVSLTVVASASTITSTIATSP